MDGYPVIATFGATDFELESPFRDRRVVMSSDCLTGTYANEPGSRDLLKSLPPPVSQRPWHR